MSDVEPALEFQFCSVFKFGRRLFLGHEEGHAGPRLLLFPPEELAPSISADDLGARVLGSLMSYRQTGIHIRGPQWEPIQRQLLSHFGVASVAAFERKKRDVTVRREVASGEIALFSGKRDPVEVLQCPSEGALGARIRVALSNV